MPRTLTLSGFTADDKTYDSTAAVSGGGFIDDRLVGDNLEFIYDAAFSDKNVGTDKIVNFSNIAISGGKNNYVLASTTGAAAADITPKQLTVTNAVAQDKEYDGTTDATVTGAALSGVVISDDVTLENYTSGTFAQADVGENIAVTTAITLAGADAGNYYLIQPTLTADIYLSDRDAVSADKANLEITFNGSDTAAGVTQNISLPISGENGTSITWTSGDTDIISVTGTVYRPLYTDGDKDVMLTASIKKNDAEATRAFAVTVLKMPATDEEAVLEDKQNLTIGFAPGEDASGVTQDMTFPTAGSCGTTIRWLSSNPAIVSSTGAVTDLLIRKEMRWLR
jgi:hypothetical protein